MPDRAQRMLRGLRQGLLDAGYSGAGEIFPWNTGLGVVAHQDSSVEYKKGKASETLRDCGLKVRTNHCFGWCPR